MKSHKTKLKKEKKKIRTEYNSRWKASIEFTKLMQIELSKLLQMLFNVKFHSNPLERVQSNQISKLFEITN